VKWGRRVGIACRCHECGVYDPCLCLYECAVCECVVCNVCVYVQFACVMCVVCLCV
jgi:hypothetical protein